MSCGWNSKSFVFYSILHYLRNDKDPKKLVSLASNNGLFNFESFMTTNEGHGGPVLREAFYGDASAAAATTCHTWTTRETRRRDRQGSTLTLSWAVVARLDMKEVCAKAQENLADYNLNAVLAKVSQVGDKMAILKDPIDNAKQLLGYLSLKTAKEQAPVHK